MAATCGSRALQLQFVSCVLSKVKAGGLLRARCKCRSDGALGWITIQSTAGVEAFKPCSASGPA
eukprot:2763423-Amphidinium_carterae.1